MCFPHWSCILNLLCLCQSFSQRVSEFSSVTCHTMISQAFSVGQDRELGLDLTSLGFESRFGSGAGLASWISLRFTFRLMSGPGPEGQLQNSGSCFCPSHELWSLEQLCSDPLCPLTLPCIPLPLAPTALAQ